MSFIASLGSKQNLNFCNRFYYLWVVCCIYWNLMLLKFKVVLKFALEPNCWVAPMISQIVGGRGQRAYVPIMSWLVLGSFLNFSIKHSIMFSNSAGNVFNSFGSCMFLLLYSSPCVSVMLLYSVFYACLATGNSFWLWIGIMPSRIFQI